MTDPAAARSQPEAQKICAKDQPWQRGDGRAVHPDAKLLYEEYNGLSGGGDYERYECPHCGLRFYVELPDGSRRRPIPGTGWTTGRASTVSNV